MSTHTLRTLELWNSKIYGLKNNVSAYNLKLYKCRKNHEN